MSLVRSPLRPITRSPAYSPLQPRFSIKNTQSAMDPFNPADSVYDGGEKWVANYAGILVPSPAGVPAVEGGELINGVWHPPPSLSTKKIRTIKDGRVNQYAPPDWGGILIEGARTNYFLNSNAPVTQNITTLAGSYTLSLAGAGSVTLSGSATGVATAAEPLTVSATAGTLTCTVAGAVEWVQLEEGSFATSPTPTQDTTVTRTADVLSYPSEGRIRAQNCAIMGIVVPIRFLDTTGQQWFYTAADDDNRLLVYATSLGFIKRYDGNYTAFLPSQSHKKDTLQQYQALWTDQGYATRSRYYENGAWQPWTAWNTNSDSRPALIGTEFFIGSFSGGTLQADARYPSFKTLFLPDRASLAEYLAYVERSTVWQEVI
jgi:hypothetical protein